RDADPRIYRGHLAQAPLEGLAQFMPEGLVAQRHQSLGLSRHGGPDDRAPVLVALTVERQECQRAVIGEPLPGSLRMRAFATHTGDNGMVQIVPFTGGATGQAAHRRVGAIGGHQQWRTQFAAGGQGQQPAIATAPQLLQAGPAEPTDTAVVQALQQGILDYAVLDDVAQHFGMHAGRREMHAAGPGAVPYAHVAVGRNATAKHAVPGAETFEDALARSRQRADPRLEGSPGGKRPDAQRAAVNQQDLQTAVFQRQRQGAADHAGANDDQVRLHLVSLGYSRPRTRLETDIKGLVRDGDQGAVAYPDLHVQLRQVLVAPGGLVADLDQQGVVDTEIGIHRALAGADEVDAGGFVPDDVIVAEQRHQQQHVEGVDHAVQRAAELGADEVAVVPAQGHLHPSMASVRADLL